LRQRVRHLVLFGKAGAAIGEQLAGSLELPLQTVATLADAVQAAAGAARPGDVVLLSPGCASFDEFKDYAERGQRFREFVESL
jgi:UDP-N-acetylmuramoylalanine--D-glutamate ligase